MDMVITPRMGDGQNSDMYWVGGSNAFPVTRAKSIQARRPNDFRSASIIVRNCMEGLPYEKEPSLEESKSKTTLTSWIDWMRSHMEDNGMDTIFRV